MNVLWSYIFFFIFNSSLNEVYLLAYVNGVQSCLTYWHHAFIRRPYFWLVVTSWQRKVFLGCSVFTALLIKGFRHQTYTHQQHSSSGVPTTTVPPPHKRPRLPLSYPRVPAALRAVEGLHCVEWGTWFWLVPNWIHTLSHTYTKTHTAGSAPSRGPSGVHFLSETAKQYRRGLAASRDWLRDKGGAKLHGQFNYWLTRPFFHSL